MKSIKFKPLSCCCRRPLIIFTGLALLAASFISLAQQSGTAGTDNHDNFDLDVLVERIIHTKSLGFLTKLSLKKDTDKFLRSMRNYHDGTKNDSLEQLHERYDIMVHKLMFLVQEKDAELSKFIDDGRDQLWTILSDESKFANL